MEIDYVVPMVFPEDALWREDFRKYVLPSKGGHALWSSWHTGRSFLQIVKRHFPWIRDIYLIFKRKGSILWQRDTQRDFNKSPGKYINSYSRWRSWGTERQLIQLVRKNLPWVRYIYVILARESQLRDWMNDEKVRVVYHNDFIPHKYLPTFNSNTIEMFLHKIPGLSEYFIYGNDDMFPLSPMEESDFFMDGKPCQHMDEVDWPLEPNTFEKKSKNAQTFVAHLFSKGIPEKWLKNGHSLAPIKKSTCEKIWEKGEKEIKASITMLRSEKSFSQYIYPWWQHYSEDYIDKSFPKLFINSSDVTPEQLSKIIQKADCVLCINDYSTNDFESLSKVAKESFEAVMLRESITN